MLYKSLDGRRLLSVLLVLALIISFFPINLVQASGEFLGDPLTVTEETYNSVAIETYGLTKAENALLKARAYYEAQSHQVDNTSSFYSKLAAMRSAGVDLGQINWQSSPWNEDTVWQTGKNDIGAVREYAGYILGSLALGQDPKVFGQGKHTKDLVKELSAKQSPDGSFGHDILDQIWSMIALDAVGANYNKGKALEYLIREQTPQGSFEQRSVWDGIEYIEDVTGWSLIVIANHTDHPKAQEAINNAVDYLKGIQLPDGDFGKLDVEHLNPNVNLLATIISGLIAVGEDLDSPEWTTNQGQTPSDALLSYQLANGSFVWTVDYPGDPEYAMKDAVVALGELITGQSFWEQLTKLPKPIPVYTKRVTFQVESFDQSIFPKQELVIQTNKKQLSALDVLEHVLGNKGIPYEISGTMLSSINGVEYGEFGGWDGWNYLINGHYSTEYMPGDWLVTDGDYICFYYGGEKNLYPDSDGASRVEQLTLVPQITIEPANPIAGQELKIMITANYDIRDLSTDKVIGNDTAKIAEAKVLFNNREFITDQQGQVTIPGSVVKQGENTLKVSKDVENSYPQLVRWEQNIIAVADGGNGGTSPKQDTVTFSVRGLNQYIFSTKEVSLGKNDTPYSVLTRVLPGQVEASGSGSSLYVKKIAGLAEFDHGAGSGWMYAVNGEYPSQAGAGSYLLQPGDIVEWRYTTNLGQDLGAGGSGGNVSPSLPTEYVSKQNELNKLSITADNSKSVLEVGKTVIVQNKDKQMSRDEAEKLRKQLEKNRFTLQETIAPALGGTLEDSQKEVTLFIPAEGIDSKIDFQVQKLANSEQEEVLSGIYEFKPAGIQFEKPVFISIKIPLLVDDLEHLALAWWNEKTKQWIPIPAVVDAETGIVTGTVTHFTKFAVIDKSKLPGFETEAPWKKALQHSLDLLKKKSELSEWEAYSLARAGEDVSAAYVQSLEELLKGNKAEFRKVTDLERIILSLSALGVDPQQFAGFNLVEKLYDHPNMTMQGTNGAAFALIALDSKAFHIPEGAEWNREKLVQWILAQQNKDGGFSLSKADGAPSDVDITAMVLQSLSVYQKRPDVQKAIEDALAWLSKKQLESGGFANIDGLENSESVAQVLIALTSLDIDPSESRFVKSKGDVLNNLLSYAEEGGHFAHIHGIGKNNVATEQATLALIAYKLWYEQELPLFDLRKVEVESELPKADQLLGYADEEQISFWAKEAVKLAGEYGLMQGVSKDVPRFEPQRAITRAEFATLLDNLAGDTRQLSNILSFKDVSEQNWYYLPVARAVEKGWIKGVSADNFEPNRAITREEMAVMIQRMLQLEQISNNANPNDINEISTWAIPAVIQVYAQELIVGDQGYFRPQEQVTREMAAVVMVRLHQLLQQN